MSKLSELSAIVEAGNCNAVVAATQAALDEGNPPLDVLNVGLIEPINVLGERFRLGKIFVPQLLIASKAMKMGVEVIKPLLLGDSVQKLGKFIICTVEGDMHDIGKNLVALLFEAAGFDVIDLGMDISPDEVVEAVQENDDVQILGMSAMLTTTMYAMKSTIEALQEAGLRNKVKIMVGGAPVNQAFCEQIGADCYTPNAPLAVEAAKALIA